MIAPVVVWVLRRPAAEEPITCAILPGPGGKYTLSVTMAERTVYSEAFDEEQDALAHALFLFDDYVKSGWTEVVVRDSRV